MLPSSSSKLNRSPKVTVYHSYASFNTFDIFPLKKYIVVCYVFEIFA